MIRFFLHPAARRDISEIWLYTADTWGIVQADDYVRQIERDMTRAIDFPDIGVVVPGLAREYRKLNSGSHRIFYLRSGDGLTVLRILHERQDIPEEWPA